MTVSGSLHSGQYSTSYTQTLQKQCPQFIKQASNVSCTQMSQDADDIFFIYFILKTENAIEN